jgi:hypothetical protein
MRAVGVEQEFDFAGRATCRIVDAKVDQIFDEVSGARYEINETK